jgi:hypothetical protein
MATPFFPHHPRRAGAVFYPFDQKQIWAVAVFGFELVAAVVNGKVPRQEVVVAILPDAGEAAHQN